MPQHLPPLPSLATCCRLGTGMIKEEAAHRLGGELQLAQAVARGAVKVVKQQGMGFYVIPSLTASSQERVDMMQDMVMDKEATGEAFEIFQEHLESVVWKIGDGEVQKVWRSLHDMDFLPCKCMTRHGLLVFCMACS